MNTLREAAQEYVRMRQALGFKLRETGARLMDFAAFMEQHHASYITQQLALIWAQQSAAAQPSTWAQRLCFVRGFARYRSATDPRTQIPPESLLPFRPQRAQPYFYTDKEIQSLLRAALNLPSNNGELRPWTYHALFGLLSVSGMRLGEARNLELQDVDLKAAVLTVRGAKFGKSRLLPLHASTCNVLADYLARREQFWLARPNSPYLFVSNRGNRLDGGEIHRTFYALSRQIGLRGLSDSHGPRIHDLRQNAESRKMPSGAPSVCGSALEYRRFGMPMVRATRHYFPSSYRALRNCRSLSPGRNRAGLTFSGVVLASAASFRARWACK